ncbi:MAG: ABC transporter ATP-binding protein [Armatimonadota bacterium]|nr:ABC transporter ATP-binding protein [Armatimonadota bacterium]
MSVSDASPWPAPGQVAVRLNKVTHRYPARRGQQVGGALALDGVSLTISTGRLFGVLGPNGAGKTTLLRLVCGRLRPAAGRLDVLGFDPAVSADEVRRRLGAALGGERSLYWRLTGRENLLYAAALYDLPSRTAEERVAGLLRMLDLEERADDLVERYSTGMRQRLALARALVADPPVLVLDEPTAGLDPQALALMRRLLTHLRDDRVRTILMATHNIADAERLCDEVAILDRGRLVACGAPDALRAQHAAAGEDGGAPSLEDVFLALTGRPFTAADVAVSL